ncbi:superfamily I DNA/RNA helicase [Clostridium beijerinckii]|uniref:3'-5' exonuclease n=1 Tax=Clostridium beijerinckii TaxID=1520 RepID=UPI00156D8729|nr:3'-5' exonuclease [Clostridium beijerinckii]NRT33993.1 superfamily I DNA/RNA helicase [Clostridium beijerinckii]NRT46577.1 superfamily I DNA/RNA helicase [Clostridium beijerinckii]NRZ19418.1 superfamily I DNA/RNA helicase [Clostridium beijerinckii]
MAIGLSEEDLDSLFEEERKIPDVWLIPKEDLEGIQNDILKDDTYNFIVEGTAGSGKSVLATYKFMDLVAIHGSNNVTLVVYTLALKEFIKNGLENTIELYQDEMYTNIKIDELNIFTCENSSLDKKIDNREFKYILIDEAQDMKKEFIKKVGNNIENLMFFGDDGQTLYKDRISMKAIQQNIPKQLKKYVIDKHYRVPRAIMKFAQRIVERNDLVDNCSREEISYKPTVVKCRDLYNELDFIIDIIEKYSLKNVGILINNGKEAFEDTRKYFDDRKYKYKYKLDRDTSTLNFNDVDNPTIITYHSSKGLQFDTVFIICCDNNSIYATKKNDKFNYRNSLFVACTRAQRRLYITCSGILNEFMRNINSNLYERINY